ncbi:MAG TPA: hypothetical protein VGE45_18680 [Chloroflexia bacterium]|jgi:hypothetical protein
MSQLEVFVQGEDIREVMLVKVDANGTVRDLVKAALPGKHEGKGEHDVLVMLEDSEETLELDKPLEAVGVVQRSHVHIHRCRRIDVTVNFNGNHIEKHFPPSATVKRVKAWTVGKHGFDLPPIDAAEHLLQVCNSSVRPDEDTHIGTLAQHPKCALCFDLLPKIRVEG